MGLEWGLDPRGPLREALSIVLESLSGYRVHEEGRAPGRGGRRVGSGTGGGEFSLDQLLE